MDKNYDSKQQINIDLLRLMMEFVRLDRMTQNYGTDTPIYHAEIHALAAITEEPGIHIGGLAEKLGVAKASVSELVKKLEKKGLVKKDADTNNLSRLSLSATGKGVLAHETHMRYHAVLSEAISAELADATAQELDFLSGFIASLTDKLSTWQPNDS
jgi:DNA-binding MarR family transcriptional regulator